MVQSHATNFGKPEAKNHFNAAARDELSDSNHPASENEELRFKAKGAIKFLVNFSFILGGVLAAVELISRIAGAL